MQHETSLPAPPVLTKPLLDATSAEEDEVEDLHHESISESNHLIPQSDSEELVFASQLVHQNGASFETDFPSLVMDPVPQISLPRVNITSWRKFKQEPLGSGSFGTV